MNEQMQEALTEIIKKASGGIDASISFLSREIPDVVQQLLLWNVVKSGLLFAIGLMLLCAAVVLWRAKIGMSKSDAREAYKNGEPWTRFGGNGSVTSIEYNAIMALPEYGKNRIPAAALMILGLIWLTSNLGWLQIILAPKIWLIEYAASLAK
ncbi:MAG: hypothetical protein ACRC8G_09125 [Plesiomonas shigelloides]